MKILIFTPTYRLESRTLQSLFSIDTMGYSVDWMLSWDNPGDGKTNILKNYNKARHWSIIRGYDYLITVESDMIVPNNLLDLVQRDLPVVYGLYAFRAGGGWNLQSGVRNDGSPRRSIIDCPDIRNEADGDIITVSGLGLGCTAISRRVLRDVKFRRHKTNHNDYSFAVDCNNEGIEQYGHLGVICGHIGQDGTEQWPELESWSTTKVEGNSVPMWDVLHKQGRMREANRPTFDMTQLMAQPNDRNRGYSHVIVKAKTAFVHSHSGSHGKGDEFALPTGQALDLSRSGLLEILRPAPNKAGLNPHSKEMS